MKNIHTAEINFVKAIKDGFKPANFYTTQIDYQGTQWTESVVGDIVTTTDMNGQWTKRYDNKDVCEAPDDMISTKQYQELTTFLTEDNIDDVISFMEELSADEEKHAIKENGSWYTNPWEKPNLTDLQKSIIEWLYN